MRSPACVFAIDVELDLKSSKRSLARQALCTLGVYPGPWKHKAPHHWTIPPNFMLQFQPSFANIADVFKRVPFPIYRYCPVHICWSNGVLADILLKAKHFSPGTGTPVQFLPHYHTEHQVLDDSAPLPGLTSSKPPLWVFKLWGLARKPFHSWCKVGVLFWSVSSTTFFTWICWALRYGWDHHHFVLVSKTSL